MTHSKQAMEVISKCDFPEEDCYPWIEKLCLQYTHRQIISLVWAKDKGGVHDWDWFVPFFGGYVPIIKRPIVIKMDTEFWKAYDRICNFVKPFSVDYMGLISEMSKDTLRLEEAIKMSRPNLKYVHIVWQDLEPRPVFTNDADAMPEIKNYGVQT